MADIKTLLARFKRSIFKRPFLKDKRLPAFWMDKLLPEEAYLIQIGSNDGKTGDPLYPLLQKNKKWKALFVEPVPYSFEKLKNNYPDTQRFSFENVAINEGKSMEFYWVNAAAKDALPDLPYWFDQLGSFDKQHILKHFDGALAPFIQTKMLEGINLETLFSRNEVQQISVLHIDTEGYDWKILSQLNLQQFQPMFILFEHHHLTEKERSAATQFLGKTYTAFTLGIDTLAVHNKLGLEEINKMKKYMS